MMEVVQLDCSKCGHSMREHHHGMCRHVDSLECKCYRPYVKGHDHG